MNDDIFEIFRQGRVASIRHACSVELITDKIDDGHGKMITIPLGYNVYNYDKVLVATISPKDRSIDFMVDKSLDTVHIHGLNSLIKLGYKANFKGE